MKNLAAYLPQVITGILAVAVLAAGFLLASGCKTAPANGLAARVAVTYATAKYIERADTDAQRAARAERIISVVTQVEALANNSGEVTVAILRAYVTSRLPDSLSNADRILAATLIDVAAAELEARISQGELKADVLLKVAEVLQWVKEGAADYAGS